jgi:hypothetical protein
MVSWLFLDILPFGAGYFRFGDNANQFRNHRAQRTSVLILNSTRKYGNPALRASRTDYAYASRENVTMKRVPRKSFTATSKPSTSRILRVCKLLLLRTTHRSSVDSLHSIVNGVNEELDLMGR